MNCTSSISRAPIVNCTTEVDPLVLPYIQFSQWYGIIVTVVGCIGNFLTIATIIYQLTVKTRHSSPNTIQSNLQDVYSVSQTVGNQKRMSTLQGPTIYRTADTYFLLHPSWDAESVGYNWRENFVIFWMLQINTALQHQNRQSQPLGVCDCVTKKCGIAAQCLARTLSIYCFCISDYSERHVYRTVEKIAYGKV